jgi:hypothetical protein
MIYILIILLTYLPNIFIKFTSFAKLIWKFGMGSRGSAVKFLLSEYLADACLPSAACKAKGGHLLAR